VIITNERQYKHTKAQISRLQDEMTIVREQHARQALDPLMMKLQKDSHSSLIDDLHSQIREYEKLRSGTLTKLRVNSFLDLPKLLIRARIARGWTQKDLAQRLNLHEQKIQQYEADEYASASFKRLYEMVKALGIEVAITARLEERKPESASREEHSFNNARSRQKAAKHANFSRGSI
jgi:HTH-type transcriptional regulator/antitoxin HigA